MISLDCLSQLDVSKYDEVWVICRSVGELAELFQAHTNVLHIPALSPSPALFRWYRELYHAGAWSEEQFHTQYVPRFLQQISTDTEGLYYLDRLLHEGTEKNIALVCFCEQESLCHRSIVGGVLLNLGAEIRCDPAYIKYRLICEGNNV